MHQRYEEEKKMEVIDNSLDKLTLNEIKDKKGKKFLKLEEAHRILNNQLDAIRKEVKTLLDNVNKKNEESEEKKENAEN